MKLSILLAAYNIRDYIDSAIFSVIHGIVNNPMVELLILDDESDDGTWECIQKWTCYENVKAVRVNHSGLGALRNHGLRIARGEYILFLDGDDYLKAGWFEALKESLSEGSHDLIIFQWRTVSDDGNQLSGPHGKCSIADMTVACWNKCYRKEVIRNQWFPENVYFEDSGFSLLAWEKSKSRTFVGQVLYMHRNRLQGISRRTNSFEEHMGVLSGLTEALNYKGPDKTMIKIIAADIVIKRLIVMNHSGQMILRNEFEIVREFFYKNGLFLIHLDRGPRHLILQALVSYCICFNRIGAFRLVLRHFVI